MVDRNRSRKLQLAFDTASSLHRTCCILTRAWGREDPGKTAPKFHLPRPGVLRHYPVNGFTESGWGQQVRWSRAQARRLWERSE